MQHATGGPEEQMFQTWALEGISKIDMINDKSDLILSSCCLMFWIQSIHGTPKVEQIHIRTTPVASCSQQSFLLRERDQTSSMSMAFLLVQCHINDMNKQLMGLILALNGEMAICSSAANE